jgi:DNA-binding HxlR family transcriptional regulator
MVLLAAMEDGTEKSLSHMCNTEAGTEVRRVLDLVGDKWSLLVIALLGQGPRRFTMLKREIGSISHRMLTLTLRQLERNGLVLRTVYPVVPPRVEYQLTDLGRTLWETIQGIVAWTLGHLPEIAAARADYDARQLAGDGTGRTLPGSGGATSAERTVSDQAEAATSSASAA